MGTENKTLEQSFARNLAADAAFAFLVGLLASLVLASLSAAGVITMALARLLLITAWVVGIFLIFAITPIWRTTKTHKTIFALILAGLLFGVERFEASHQSQPPTAPTAEEIAQRVESLIKRDQPPTRPPSPITPASSSRPMAPYRIVVNIPPPTRSSPQTATAVRPPSGTDNSVDVVLDRIHERQTRQTALSSCTHTEILVNVGLYKLDEEAVTALNGWAYSRSDKKLYEEYVSWVGKVDQFFADNQDSLHDTSKFDQIPGPKMMPAIPLISNNGTEVWIAFNAKRKELEGILGNHNSTACKSESDAVSALDAAQPK